MTLPASTANPYVGPRTFSYEQRDRFFGREREARDLLARVLSERLLLFYAQSGAGKSSLLHTRLIPQLREEKGFAVLPVGRVGGDLPAGLAEVDNIFLFNLMSSIDQSDDARPSAHLSLGDFLERLVLKEDGRWLYDASAVPAPAPHDTPGRRYALIVDQFEEIITAHPERWRERDEFFRQLNQAMLDDPNLWVVLTLREDYVAALDPYAPLMAEQLRARFYMERLGVAGALEAVRRPVEMEALGERRRPFAPGVAERLVDNLRQMRVPGQKTTVPGPYVEPVQLQVVCYQLWENLGRGTPPTVQPLPTVQPVAMAEITMADLDRAGDVDRALTHFYEDTIRAVLDDSAAGLNERQLRTWFDEQMVTEAGTRGLVHQDEHETGGLPNAVVGELQKHFMVRAETRSGDTWIELVHDRFVEPILAANRRWRKKSRNPLTSPTEKWLQSQRDSRKLISGSQLIEAERFAEANPRLLSDEERDFLKASRARARRQRVQALLALAIFGALIALTVVALRNSREAERESRLAQSHDLAARAQALLSENPPNPSVALMLASEAMLATWRQDGQVSPFVSENLLDTMSRAPVRPLLLPRHRHASSITFASYSPDGSLLATTSQDGTAKLWTADDGALVATLYGNFGPVKTALFSPDGSRLVTAGDDRTARVWPVPQDKTVRNVVLLENKILAGHDGTVNSALFSPDGEQVITSSDDGTVRLWDASTGKQKSILEQQDHKMLWASFSPDGSRAVTAGEDAKATIWDRTEQTALATLEGHTDWIRSAFFSPDGAQVVTASDDGTVRLWDAATGAPLLEPFSVPAALPYAAFANFSPDGQWIAAVGSKKVGGRYEISVWDVANGKKSAAWTGHVSTPRSVSFDPAPTRRWSGNSPGTPRALSAAPKRCQPSTGTAPGCATPPSAPTAAAS